MTDNDWAHERATKIFSPIQVRNYLSSETRRQWHAEVAEALREERAQARKKLAEEMVSDLLALSDVLGKART